MPRMLAVVAVLSFGVLHDTAAADVRALGTVAEGQLVGAADGTYAYISGPGTLTYGVAGTSTSRAALDTDDCSPVAAHSQVILIRCYDHVSQQYPPPALLDTRSGKTSSVSASGARGSDVFFGIGARWIAGLRPAATGDSSVFVDRFSGATRVLTPVRSYDLDDPDLTVRPVPRRTGTATLAFDTEITVRTTLSSGRLQVVRDGRVRTIGTARAASLSPTVVAWAEGNRVRRYSRSSGRITTTVLPRSPGAIHVIAQRRGVLAVTPTRKGRPPTRILRITN